MNTIPEPLRAWIKDLKRLALTDRNALVERIAQLDKDKPPEWLAMCDIFRATEGTEVSKELDALLKEVENEVKK